MPSGHLSHLALSNLILITSDVYKISIRCSFLNITSYPHFKLTRIVDIIDYEVADIGLKLFISQLKSRTTSCSVTENK